MYEVRNGKSQGLQGDSSCGNPWLRKLAGKQRRISKLTSFNAQNVLPSLSTLISTRARGLERGGRG
jgi:hypothetical protein